MTRENFEPAIMASSEGESPSEANPVLTPRAYQLEMLEESLRQNTIVAVSMAELCLIGCISNQLAEWIDGHWQWKNSNVRTPSLED